MRLLPLKLLIFLLLNLELSNAQVPPGAHSDHSEPETHTEHESLEKHDDPHGDHHEEEGDHDEFGEDKAIQGIKGEGRFFKLSTEAIQTLSIAWAPLTRQENGYILPKSAIVQFRGEKGVYVYRNGWFHLIVINPTSVQSGKVFSDSPEIQSEDQLVVKGVPLVRVAHLQASGQGGEGHAH